MINPDSAEDVLERRFLTMCSLLGGQNELMARRWWVAIVNAYKEQKHRHFHDEVWLFRTLRTLDDSLSWDAIGVQKPEAIFCAIYFFKFRMKPDADEFDNRMDCLRSAAEFMRDIGMTDGPLKKFVINIMSSIYNGEVDAIPSYRFFNDAIYDWYSEPNHIYRQLIAKLRAENGLENDIDFIEKRREELSVFKKRKCVYYTDQYSYDIDDLAMLNISWELNLYDDVMKEMSKQQEAQENPIALPART